jgi:hypothetical protein
MTHDELLAKVETDQEVTKYLDKGLVSGDITINVARQHWFQSNALRAVVELHQIILVKNHDDTDWYSCQACGGIEYPCETIEAIEKELA